MKSVFFNAYYGCICFFMSFIVLSSCSEGEVLTSNGDTADIYTDTAIRLLIKGEGVSLPTKGMSNEVEQGYTSDLLIFILREDNSGTYRYETSRPVEGSKENYTVKIPNSLDNSKLKLILFSNSKDILGNDPDIRFKVDGVGSSEQDIRSQLLITLSSKWDLKTRIPMWGESGFRFSAPNASQTVANLSLVRMLARVDVGLNFKSNAIDAEKLGLPNFRMHKVKVCNVNNSGQLLPNLGSYSITDNKVSVIKPSVPKSVSNLGSYEISALDSTRGFEREIYLFEQDNDMHSTVFKPERACVLVQGSYITDSGLEVTGWYRLDFYNFNSSKQFSDILRNTLYRFNIKSVSGPGFSNPDDALNSIASNITVELQAYDLTQNDIVFDGQNFLSVNKSELFFYKNSKSANFNFTTDYKQGWTIENTNTDITVSPAAGKELSAVINLDWQHTPSSNEDKKIYIKAGNLRKEIVLRYLDELAPGYLQRFSLTPATLYYLRAGGVGSFEILSNLQNFFLSKNEGFLQFEIPNSPLVGTHVSADVKEYKGPSNRDIETGVINVQVNAANASLSAQCNIMQLTYDKSLHIAPQPLMPCDPEGNTGKAHLKVEFTPEKPEKYMIQFAGINGGESIDKILAVNNFVDIRALPNRSKDKRKVGELIFTAAENGQEIPLIGFTPTVIPIMQEGTPPPEVTITARPDGETIFYWNKTSAQLVASIGDLNHVSGLKDINLSYSGDMFTGMNNQTKTAHGVNLVYHMGENRTSSSRVGLIKAIVAGYDNQIGENTFTITQNAAPSSKPPVVLNPNITVDWKQTSARLKLGSLLNIYDVKVQAISSVAGSLELPVTHENLFTMASDKSSAFLDLKFPTNVTDKDKKLQITVVATGNIATETYTYVYTLTQTGQKNGAINILGDNPKNLGWQAGTHQIRYNVININESTLSVRGSTDWLTVELSSDTNGKIIMCRVKENITGSPRSASIELSGTDFEGNQILTTLLLTQDKQLQGRLVLNPDMLEFSRSASQGKSMIVKENIPGDLHIDLQKTDKWLSGVINGNLMTVDAQENIDHARQGSLVLFGYDLNGIKREAQLSVKQESNIVRIPGGDLVSPYRYNEGVDNVQLYPSFRVGINGRSLPFDPSSVKYTLGSEATNNHHIFQVNPSQVDGLIGKEIEILFIPTTRTTTYKTLEIPLTLHLKTEKGVESTAEFTIKREGHPAVELSTTLPSTYTAPTADGHVWPGLTHTISGEISTKNLQPNSAISVEFMEVVADPAHKEVTISRPFSGLNPVPANANVNVVIKLTAGPNSPSTLNQDIRVYGIGVDGKKYTIKEIRWKGRQ